MRYGTQGEGGLKKKKYIAVRFKLQQRGYRHRPSGGVQIKYIRARFKLRQRGHRHRPRDEVKRKYIPVRFKLQ